MERALYLRIPFSNKLCFVRDDMDKEINNPLIDTIRGNIPFVKYKIKRLYRTNGML